MNFNWALLGLLNPFEEGSRKQRLSVAAACLSVLLIVGWFGADTGFGRASGLAEGKYRIQMMGNALFWEYRASTGRSVQGEVGKTYRGYIDKGQKSFLLVYLYDGEGRRRQVVSLANVNNETVELTSFAERYRGQSLRFDLFSLPTEKYPRALIWNIDVPLNLDVIEEGGGPDINPPTNVVDRIFANYYWRLFQKGH
ncbi:hypothetical protein LN429_15720 [Pseudomonas syringae]|uniref:hypothetical protein n=1 Tax=Pseudomonas syringae TaxID=317 RepID=UPI00234D8394|nr:hypothetical protein [Pseudomonas syringae]MDC6536553.1 hypothetical protein [Pseudomonas syringae]